MLLSNLLREAGKSIPRPFGIFLSGGLDSGILAALLQPDIAISCHFEGEFYDELEYAYAITQHLNIQHYVIKPSEEEFTLVMEKAMEIIKKPLPHVSIFPWFMLMSAAKDLGMENMIGGEGSDETFGGYSRYLILKGIKDLYEMESLQGYHPLMKKTIGDIADIHSRIIGVSCETLTKRYAEKEGFINQISWAEFKESLPSLVDMEHKFAGHFGIKLHLPYFDKKVQEYGWSLKDEDKIKDEIRKMKIWEIAKELLPEKVWQRKDKKGLVCPANEWCGSENKWDKTNYLKMQEELCCQS